MQTEASEHLDAHTTALYAIIVVILVLGSGLMSGLTLGLLSLDVMDLEVGGACMACWHMHVLLAA